MAIKHYKRKYASKLAYFAGRPDSTPFVDVFFLLLIFLTLSMPFVEVSGVEVRLPRVEAARVRTGLERFIITIAAKPDGTPQIYFNDKPLAMDALAEELSEVSRQTKMKMIIVRADSNIPHAAVTEVMTIAARFGLSTFLATGQPDSTKRPGSTSITRPGE